ncbi:MAG: ABC transporter ATP-binding protein [Lachnospiraceae bacterium]|jgi:peptide/nickel transport system ATP-binding protein|nr:ABC transporter ATP-binding protein [Lachnospiraceae bacterium]NBJ80482.1 ABC transporter ATP-binding protein [bacterium 1XD42-76]NBK03691.1 ABC transporter ATP-binding protein [bacterium 1XD42-94]
MSEEVKKENTNAKDLTAEIKDLVVEFRTDYGVVQALNSMELEIERGKTLGLVGETGAGKTTTGLSLLRLIPDPPGVIVKGSIKLDGKDILSMSDKEMQDIRGKAVAMIFQDPMTSLDPVMTVENQIAEVIKLHEEGGMEHALTRAREMLELVGIPGSRGSEYPHQFSGGMKQRVVIAMALACNPELLIADEPTTALDVTIQAQVLEMMKGLREKYNTSMLMITHDLGIVAEICDKVSVIYAGHVIEHGTLVDIFKNTRHPYTEGLFNSLPNLENRTAELKPIKGLMPDPSNLPKGCAFCPRCDYAMEICKTEKPKRVYRNDTHYVECHLYNEDNIQEGKVSIR